MARTAQHDIYFVDSVTSQIIFLPSILFHLIAFLPTSFCQFYFIIFTFLFPSPSLPFFPFFPFPLLSSVTFCSIYSFITLSYAFLHNSSTFDKILSHYLLSSYSSLPRIIAIIRYLSPLMIPSRLRRPHFNNLIVILSDSSFPFLPSSFSLPTTSSSSFLLHSNPPHPPTLNFFSSTSPLFLDPSSSLSSHLSSSSVFSALFTSVPLSSPSCSTPHYLLFSLLFPSPLLSSFSTFHPYPLISSLPLSSFSTFHPYPLIFSAPFLSFYVLLTHR